jgi:hypothetical protein
MNSNIHPGMADLVSAADFICLSIYLCVDLSLGNATTTAGFAVFDDVSSGQGSKFLERLLTGGTWQTVVCCSC